MENNSNFRALFNGKTEGETPSTVPGLVLKGKALKITAKGKEGEKEKAAPVATIATKTLPLSTKDYRFNPETGNLLIVNEKGEKLELDIPYKDWKQLPDTPVISKEQFGKAVSSGGFKGVGVMQQSRFRIADLLEKEALSKGAKYTK